MTVLVALDVLFDILVIAIIIRAIVSWFSLSPNNPVLAILFQITEPILAPLRGIVPRVGMLDITPLVAILLLRVIRYLIFFIYSLLT
jgi:YggT family protein